MSLVAGVFKNKGDITADDIKVLTSELFQNEKSIKAYSFVSDTGGIFENGNFLIAETIRLMGEIFLIKGRWLLKK